MRLRGDHGQREFLWATVGIDIIDDAAPFFTEPSHSMMITEISKQSESPVLTIFRNLAQLYAIKVFGTGVGECGQVLRLGSRIFHSAHLFDDVKFLVHSHPQNP